jgi:hypothetical protein
MNPTLPASYCPFPSAIHPAVASGEASMLEFCRRDGMLRRGLTPETLRAMRVAEFVARAYPNTSLDRLAIVLDWTHRTARYPLRSGTCGGGVVNRRPHTDAYQTVAMS